MIQQHVHRIIEEVADGEAHEDVAGVSELVDEIILHLGCLRTTIRQQ